MPNWKLPKGKGKSKRANQEPNPKEEEEETSEFLLALEMGNLPHN